MGKRKGHCAGGCWSGDPQKPLGCWRSLSEEIRLVSLRGPRSPWGVGSGLQQRVIEQSLPLSSEAGGKKRPLSEELITGIVFHFLQLREPICRDFN